MLFRSSINIEKSLKAYAIPTFYVDKFVSSVIHSLHLDSIDDSFSIKNTLKQINQDVWVDEAVKNIQNDRIMNKLNQNQQSKLSSIFQK